MQTLHKVCQFLQRLRLVLKVKSCVGLSRPGMVHPAGPTAGGHLRHTGGQHVLDTPRAPWQAAPVSVVPQR